MGEVTFLDVSKRFSLRVDGEILPQDPSHLQGWDWTDRSLGAIAVFGASCDALRTRDVDITADILCAE